MKTSKSKMMQFQWASKVLSVLVEVHRPHSGRAGESDFAWCQNVLRQVETGKDHRETNALGRRMKDLEKKRVPAWEIAVKADGKNSQW